MTFFTYFYYRTFGTRLHYVYFFSSTFYALMIVIETIVFIADLFKETKEDELKEQNSYIYTVFLLATSLYKIYSSYLLYQIFFLK